MITVYIWKFRLKDPDLGAKESLGHMPAAWGHASLHIGYGEPSPQNYVSWWPTREGRQPVIPYSVGPLRSMYRAPAIQGRVLKDDELSEGQSGHPAPGIPVRIDGLDEQAMLKWWQQFAHSGALWSAVGQNCSTTVAHALYIGGGDKYVHGIGGWWKSWNVVWTPNDVLLYANAIRNGLGKP